MVELVVPTVADADRIAAVINARSQALHGRSEERAGGVAKWFSLSELDPAADMRLAVAADGTAEGYSDVSTPEDGTPVARVDLRVPPGRPEVLEALFEWALGRALERVEPGGRIQFFADEGDRELQAVLAARSFAVVRSGFVMECRLDGDLQPPAWPAGLDCRRFAEEEAEVVYAAQNEAFADHWDFTSSSLASWRSYHLADGADTSLWRIAWDGTEVAGLALNSPQRGEDETVGWIDVLAVRRPWRRQGLGEALLRDAFRSFADAGKARAGLGVDAENTTGAVALYERVGMRPVRRSDTWERAA